MKEVKIIDHSDKKAFLLETAHQLFSENGFDATSVRMIAEKAGMNVAMISYYFGSKEKLFEELLVGKTNYMREQLTAIVENKDLDPWSKIELMIDGYSDRILTSGGSLHKLMMREVSLKQRTEISNLIEKRIMFNLKAVHEIIVEGIKKKVFVHNIDFPMLMSTLIGTLTQTVTSDSMFFRFENVDGKKHTKKIDVNEVNKRVKKHLKRVFARYLLIHPEKYNY